MDILADFLHEYRRHKKMADQAIEHLDDSALFSRPGEVVNPPAIIVKHLAGNLVSRFTDFLTTDGEKASRDRDGEFLLKPEDTRVSLLAAWERGWSALFDTLARLTVADLDKIITIRGEPHTVYQALVRALTHTVYHVGQIVYLARLGAPSSRWLTIAPGQSKAYSGKYRPT